MINLQILSRKITNGYIKMVIFGYFWFHFDDIPSLNQIDHVAANHENDIKYHHVKLKDISWHLMLALEVELIVETLGCNDCWKKI